MSVPSTSTASLAAGRPRRARRDRRRRAGHARDVRPADGPVLRAGAVHSGTRRGFAGLGPAGPDVHRLRRRRGGHLARSLPSGDGARADRAGENDMARVELDDQRAGIETGEEACRCHVRRARLLLQLRRRGERGGAEARAALCARSFRPGEVSHRLDAERFPRADAVHGDRRRPGQVCGRLRPRADRVHPHPLQRRRRIGSGVRRGRRRRHLRGDTGADAGRRRNDSRHAGIPGRRASTVRRARRAIDPGRDPERHGPHRRVVLLHAKRRRAGHPDQRQGARRRLSRRGDADHDRDRKRVFGRACTVRPTAATRWLARWPARCST